MNSVLSRGAQGGSFALCLFLLGAGWSHAQFGTMPPSNALSGNGNGGSDAAKKLAQAASFIIVGITKMGAGIFDIKLKNPRTGYIHSVTLNVDVNVTLNFSIGQKVKQMNDDDGTVNLIPVPVPGQPVAPPSPAVPQPAAPHSTNEPPTSPADHDHDHDAK